MRSHKKISNPSMRFFFGRKNATVMIRNHVILKRSIPNGTSGSKMIEIIMAEIKDHCERCENFDKKCPNCVDFKEFQKIDLFPDLHEALDLLKDTLEKERENAPQRIK